jgi:hypothetical protein
MALIVAFTGPLSKVPGPFIMKLSAWPWVIETITGNQMNAAPILFKKYGDTVRIGELHNPPKPDDWILMFEAAGPQAVMFAGKNAIQKIIVEDDMLKSPEYDWRLADPNITNLITERDRVAYRQKVWPAFVD